MAAKLTALKSKRERSPKARRADLARIAEGVRLILEGIGEDPNREGLRDTPKRVAEMYEELTAGMREDPSRSEEHTSELQSQSNLVCRLLLEKKKNPTN